MNAAVAVLKPGLSLRVLLGLWAAIWAVFELWLLLETDPSTPGWVRGVHLFTVAAIASGPLLLIEGSRSAVLAFGAALIGIAAVIAWSLGNSWWWGMPEASFAIWGAEALTASTLLAATGVMTRKGMLR